MLRHRCPWCGVRINPIRESIHERFFRVYDSDYDFWEKGPRLTRCPYCTNQYSSKFSLKAVLAAVVLFALFFLVRIWMISIFALVCAVLSILILQRLPLERAVKGDRSYLERYHPKTVLAAMEWKPYRKKGLLAARYRVPDHEIFPAYFLDGNHTLISAAYCVVLTEIAWMDARRCTCRLSLVLDDAPEALLEEGNSFYLYCGNRQIAGGAILPEQKE